MDLWIPIPSRRAASIGKRLAITDWVSIRVNSLFVSSASIPIRDPITPARTNTRWQHQRTIPIHSWVSTCVQDRALVVHSISLVTSVRYETAFEWNENWSMFVANFRPRWNRLKLFLPEREIRIPRYSSVIILCHSPIRKDLTHWWAMALFIWMVIFIRASSISMVNIPMDCSNWN